MGSGLIILGVFIYIIIGRIIANYIIENVNCIVYDYNNVDVIIFFITILYPLAVIWITAICIGNKISDYLF